MAKSKEPPYGRKFGQSGHPGHGIVMSMSGTLLQVSMSRQKRTLDRRNSDRIIMSADSSQWTRSPLGSFARKECLIGNGMLRWVNGYL
jgi:hypothetical protein